MTGPEHYLAAVEHAAAILNADVDPHRAHELVQRQIAERGVFTRQLRPDPATHIWHEAGSTTACCASSRARAGQPR
jgi:hypothetical protein